MQSVIANRFCHVNLTPVWVFDFQAVQIDDGYSPFPLSYESICLCYFFGRIDFFGDGGFHFFLKGLFQFLILQSFVLSLASNEIGILDPTDDPNKTFKRVRDDLTCNVMLTYPQLVFGAQVEITTIDGSKRTIKIPRGCPAGEKILIAGKGFKDIRSKTFGNLIVTTQCLSF